MAGVLRTCPLAHFARSTPDNVALITPDGETVTFRELDRRVSDAAQGLDEQMIVRGERVAIHAPLGPDLITLLLACFRRGVVAAPINLRWPAGSIKSECASIRAEKIIVNQRLEISESIRQIRLDDVLSGSSNGSADAVWDLTAPATIVFTSGSTGASKPVLHSLGNHVYNAEGSCTNIGIEPADKWLLALPLYHVGGLAILFRCILPGATIALPSEGELITDAIDRLRPTHLSLVATQLGRMLDRGFGPGARDLKAILLGGSAIEPDLIDRSLDQGLPLHVSYGMSEMSSQITTTPAGADRETLATSGRVLPFREISFDNDHILVRGETRFLGYINGEALEQPFDAEGWFRTGDTGHLDDLGRLVVTGRVDDMFISGGENIQPGRIERALTAIPGIVSAVVVPVPDDDFGRLPVAFVKKASVIRVEEIARRLRETLPGYMIPVAWFALPEDPASSMKRSRRDLEALALRLTQK